MFWRRKRSADDFRDEIHAHLQLEANELKSEGWDEDKAPSAARKAFGNLTGAEERFYESRRPGWFDDVLRDVQYGFSTMRRNPGFTVAAVLTLTLGIGVNTTIFSFVNALLLRPLPVPDSSRLISIYTSDFSGPPLGTSSYPDYLDFRDSTGSFSGIIAHSMQVMNLSTAGATERVQGHLVTENYFPVLGVTAVRGRMPSVADDDGASDQPWCLATCRISSRAGYARRCRVSTFAESHPAGQVSLPLG